MIGKTRRCSTMSIACRLDIKAVSSISRKSLSIKAEIKQFNKRTVIQIRKRTRNQKIRSSKTCKHPRLSLNQKRYLINLKTYLLKSIRSIRRLWRTFLKKWAVAKAKKFNTRIWHTLKEPSIHKSLNIIPQNQNTNGLKWSSNSWKMKPFFQCRFNNHGNSRCELMRAWALCKVAGRPHQRVPEITEANPW